MARTTEHQKHLSTNRSHNDCRECRADTERRFVATAQWRYDHVHDYLTWIQPRLEALRNGEDSINARQWLKDFRQSLDRRINLKAHSRPNWRKLCDSYQERLKNARRGRNPNASYLRQFAQTGASALN
jgi:hypothetical protein